MSQSKPTSFDAQYGPISAEYYQLTKPITGEYPDVPYYLKGLKSLPGRILEIGAGTGRLLIPLQQAGLAMEALEPSSFMRTWLSENLKERGLETPVFDQSAEDFKLKETFSAILVSFGSFQLLNPPDRAKKSLKNFYASLKPGAQLFVDLDVIHPEPDLADVWVDGPRLTVGQGVEIRIGGRRHWDFKAQTENVHLRYEKWAKGKLMNTEEQNFSLRWYGVTEFADLLSDVGFKKIESCMDYDPKNRKINDETVTVCYRAWK